jgi:hypothetical protein
MSMTLRTITDNGDLLALDQIDVGIGIVIDAHGNFLNEGFALEDRRPSFGLICVAAF